MNTASKPCLSRLSRAVFAGFATLTAAACGGGMPGVPETPEHAAGATVAREQLSVAAPAQDQVHNTEAYDRIRENPFQEAATNPLSTFAVDVDTASYSNMRRFLNDGKMPPADAIRIEELVNYFTYSYPEPTGDAPFSVTTEVASCPWNNGHRLVHIGLQGKHLSTTALPPRNLVFLLDVSGSMNDPKKLPLLQSALRLLVDQLTAKDRVAMVVYAGASGVVLPPTPGNQGHKILGALDRLRAGGSTHGSAGIQLAYQLARQSFHQGGINRVILATDGDFNVGLTSQGQLERLIEKERQSGVFLTVLGFGTGNVKDSTMETLADKGNGNYAYIDSIGEARKVLVRESGATLITIAKDVKIQVEFNPKRVQAYRLIGYENRLMRAEDFHDDQKDAGEIGAGHSVTALYEIVPPGQPTPAKGPGKLKYQKPSETNDAADSPEMLTVKLRYKAPKGTESKLLSVPVTDGDTRFDAASSNFRFSASVAAFGMLLRSSKHKGSASYAMVRALANAARGADTHGYRSEFLSLVQRAERMSPKRPTNTLAR